MDQRPHVAPGHGLTNVLDVELDLPHDVLNIHYT